jgi:Holliday junction DNA helicase RuvA
MITLLQGKIIDKQHNELVLLTSGGVGYHVSASKQAIETFSVGHEITIETYLVVKEDALDLYGFASGDEKKLFELLISVSGVGPKTALNILALGAVGDIAGAVGRGDVTYLTKVSGIGKKTAERLVLELKSKLQNHSLAGSSSGAPTGMSSVLSDVSEGLEALGYSSIEVREVIQSLDATGKTSEQLLRAALGMLGKK